MFYLNKHFFLILMLMWFGWSYQFDISSVALFFHLFFRNKAQRSAVDAISKTACFCWAIFKYMSKMGVSLLTFYLITNHSV